MQAKSLIARRACAHLMVLVAIGCVLFPRPGLARETGGATTELWLTVMPAAPTVSDDVRGLGLRPDAETGSAARNVSSGVAGAGSRADEGTRLHADVAVGRETEDGGQLRRDVLVGRTTSEGLLAQTADGTCGYELATVLVGASSIAFGCRRSSAERRGR